MGQTFCRNKSVYTFPSLFVFVGNFFFWNLESWALESGIQFKEFGIQQSIGIRNPVSGVQNPWWGIQNLRQSWIPLLTWPGDWMLLYMLQVKIDSTSKNKVQRFLFSICRFYFLKRQKHIQFSVMLIEMSLFSWYLSISAWEAKSAK